MRHRVAGRKLNRSRPHYARLMQNLACQLFKHHRIVTTISKAKEVRPYAEKLITLAREKNLANVRKAVTLLGSNSQAKDVARHLFDDIAPTFAERPGGYTRILRLGERRLGDGGERAIIELVNYEPSDRVADEE